MKINDTRILICESLYLTLKMCETLNIIFFLTGLINTRKQIIYAVTKLTGIINIWKRFVKNRTRIIIIELFFLFSNRY